MLTAKQTKAITFNDGRLVGLVLDEYKDKIIARKEPVPCGLPTVGFRRFYDAARTDGLRVDLVATIPWIPKLMDIELVEIERNDYPGKLQYKVIQIQERKDSAPPCFQFTLQRAEVGHEEQRSIRQG